MSWFDTSAIPEDATIIGATLKMSDKKTAWGQEVRWPIVGTVFGHGSYGYECEICKVSDWGGPIVHKPGCAEAAELVRKVRESKELS